MNTTLWHEIPLFAGSYPRIAETLEQTRLLFYCMNCGHKARTRFLTPDFGPLCEECINELRRVEP